MSAPQNRPRVLLATARDWLAASVAGVLDHESVELSRVVSEEEIGNRSRRDDPDAVLLDQELAGPATPELCRRLTEDVLGNRTPLIVYSSDAGDEDLQTRTLEAGAWTVVQEPIRSQFLLAILRRFLEIGYAVHERAHEHEPAERETEIPGLAGVLRRLTAFAALADRQEEPLSVVAVGPGQPGTAELVQRQRRRAAQLCKEELRRSDAYGWLDSEAELVILAYGASREGATRLAERLARRAAERSDLERPAEALCAGVMEVPAAEARQQAEKSPEDWERTLVSAARDALQRAREEGGGIKVAS